MSRISPDIPGLNTGETEATAQPKVTNALQEIVNLLNGAIDSANIAPGSITADRLAFSIQSSFIPAGIVLPTAGTTADSGFLLCDGSAVSRATYSNLFAKIGTKWGVGDGVSTFNLPNLNATNRTIVGADGTTIKVGDTGGASTHTLTEAEGPVGWVGDDRGAQSSSMSISLGDGFYTLDINTGGSAFSLMQPYAGMLFQVKT
jgi:microcystin-dependent protein